MKKIFLILLSLFSISAIAQTDTTFTLDQAISFAMENQAAVKNAELDKGSAESRVGEIRAIGLPQLNGQVQLIENLELRRMFLEASPGNPFTDPSLPPGEVVAIRNIFQLPSTGDVSATLTQLLFDGSYIVGLKAAKTYKELASKSYDQTKIETAEAVSKAFYLVLINKERRELLVGHIARLDSLLRETRVLFEEGFVEKIDVDRIEVTYNNLLTDQSKLDNLYELSLLLLKYQMGMPVGQNIRLEGAISDISIDTSVSIQSLDPSKRIEYSLLQTQRELQQLNIKNYQVQYLPRLSAFATGGYFTQNTEFFKIFNSRWYTYSMIGVNMSVPIFDGFAKRYQIKQARYDLEKVENNISNLENAIEFEAKQAMLNLKNQLRTLENQKRNMQLAAEVTRVAKIKYREGVGSNLEVTTAETSLKEAQTNYYNALYEAMIANIDYQKALGSFYIN